MRKPIGTRENICTMKRGERTKEEPLVRAPKREDKVREVTFPVEQEAPAPASEATATATSSSSALIAISISNEVCMASEASSSMSRETANPFYRMTCEQLWSLSKND